MNDMGNKYIVSDMFKSERQFISKTKGDDVLQRIIIEFWTTFRVANHTIIHDEMQ